MRNKEEEIFYKSLCFRLKISERAYHVYLNHRTYSTAHAILLTNKEILSFLKDNILYSNPSDKENLINLMIHLLGWISDFQLYAQQLLPTPDMTFIFKRSDGFLPYPKEFIDRLYIDWGI